jgi:hypothetical protein
MSRLSLGDIGELARLQRKILNRCASIDQLLERERVQGLSDEGREALARLLDDVTEAVQGMAAIVDREDEGGATTDS